jgi:hypothetical protein
LANVILILGKSGTGKSTSIKGLNPKETVIFNVLKKRLLLREGKSLYNEDNKNLFNIDDYTTIVNYMESISKNASYVKNIVVEDITYIMRKEYFKTAKISSYNKFVDIASHFQSIIQTAENLRSDINVFLIMHCEEVVSDNVIISYKPSTIGKMIDNSYNPMEVVPMVLFSSVKYDDNKRPIYGFYTHRCMEGNIEIPAKSPADMFKEDFIPNDLNLVLDAMREYYG